MFKIEEIYDAAFDRTRFATLIERLCSSFSAQSGFIGWSDDRDAGFQAQFGGDPVWLQRYVETYGAHDILRPHLMALPEGECAPAWSLLQSPEIRASVFYREYLAPQGIVDNLAVNLIKRPGITAHLALLRTGDAPPFSNDDVAALKQLIVHLRRAIFIQSHIVRAADRAAQEVSAGAGAAQMLLLLGTGRQVMEIDPVLGTLLHQSPGSVLREGRFAAAVVQAIASCEPVAILLEEDGEAVPLLLEARPIIADRFGDLEAGPAPTHAVHVTKLNQTRILAFEAIGHLYRLTATELRVLRDAMAEGNLTGIGERLGMAPATTRTHLHRIYEKTGTQGFTGLSNLVHRFGRIGPA
ncbi:conserved hypothetical protein [Altererythrobacter sp. B11]|uniref:helix-turn-helix transcriptional regulator n=1 Tax=Altererythrobacter sp. B11 TaxID=2060312 RepID=UPI000DC7274D|nr:hypothetical protein [Altererythrobacter sp. B11]BBC73385.1 conserved hypothetical protein [Altererythrobacter sp. B11]